MGNWKKVIAAMAADPRPTTYRFHDAVRVLRHIDAFALASSRGGSHRKWRGVSPTGDPVWIGLVERGHGPLKPEYITDMVRILRQHQLMPEE